MARQDGVKLHVSRGPWGSVGSSTASARVDILPDAGREGLPSRKVSGAGQRSHKTWWPELTTARLSLYDCDYYYYYYCYYCLLVLLLLLLLLLLLP